MLHLDKTGKYMFVLWPTFLNQPHIEPHLNKINETLLCIILAGVRIYIIARTLLVHLYVLTLRVYICSFYIYNT